MPQSERYFSINPESNSQRTEGLRVAPNEKLFPTEATVYVETDDGHEFTFKMFPKGPQQSEYLISLMASEPPITETTPEEKEIYVRGDMIRRGEMFYLDSAEPVLTIASAAFRALRITANITPVVLPPTQSIPIADIITSIESGEIKITPENF